MFTQSYWKVDPMFTDRRMMREERTNEGAEIILMPEGPLAAAGVVFFMTSGESACREKTKERKEEKRLTRVQAVHKS